MRKTPPYCTDVHTLGSPKVNHRFCHVHRPRHKLQHFITVYVFSFLLSETALAPQSHGHMDKLQKVKNNHQDDE